MSSEKYLTYRGNIRKTAVSGSDLYFTTELYDSKESALYILDVKKAELKEFKLSSAGVLVHLDSENKYWVCCADNRIYLGDSKTKPKELNVTLESKASAMANLSKKRVAVLLENNISVFNEKGKQVQTLDFPDVSDIGNGTSLASDPSGNYFAVGTSTGYCFVYESDGDELKLSEYEKIHEGSVNALLFEREELSFISVGSDQKVYVTHARGKLEALERGDEAHDGKITSILMGSERFYTAGFDKTIKAWAKKGKPATFKDGIGKVIDISLLKIDDREHLACACTDNSIRVLSKDDAGRLNEIVLKFHDAYKSAKRDLTQDKAADRIKTLQTLSKYDDFASLKLISSHIEKESDPDVKLRCVNFIAKSSHKKAPDFLYDYLKHEDHKLRMASFKGLLNIKGDSDVITLDKALSAKRADVGIEAVKIYEKLAKKNDQLIVKLFNALSLKTYAVRVQALYSLENIYGKKSFEASMKALQSKFEDLRKLALIRFYQRGLLDNVEVKAAIHKHCEDDSSDVRKIAFYLLIMTKKNLSDVLRSKDKNVHRQIYEIEKYGEKDIDKLPEAKDTKKELSESDFEPLLFAMACRVVDTCLEGAKLLAVLNDTRAFGLLLQLSREDDVDTRVSVSQSFAALNDKRAIKHVSKMLNDEALEVREAAFSALSKLYSDPLKLTGKAFVSDFSDVRNRALQVLVDKIRDEKEDISNEAYDLLLTALNDSDSSLGSEAFKAALNLQIKGGNENTLSFIYQSTRKDIRFEVLNEVRALEKESWAQTVLFTLFDDADKALRNEAFDYALSRKKAKEIDTLKAGISSKRVDIRLKSVENLIKSEDEEAAKVLAPAINDTNHEVRKSVIEGLVKINDRDTLIEALKSKYYDVRALAAKARAVYGDKEVFEPLTDLLAIEEPPLEDIKDPERKDTISLSEWKKLIKLALRGLAELGGDDSASVIEPFLFNKHNDIALNAVIALSKACTDKAKDILYRVIKDGDESLKWNASIGLAYLGEGKFKNIFFGEEKRDYRSVLKASFMLGEEGEDKLFSLVECSDEAVRRAAYLILILLELTDETDSPERLISCLSVKDESIRFTSAKALNIYFRGFKDFAVELFNDKGEKPAFNIPKEDVEAVAMILKNGDSFTKLKLIDNLFKLSDKKQTSWDNGFEIFKYRFEEEIKDLSKEEIKDKEAESIELKELAFGSFVGLVREQGGYHGSDRITPERVVIRIRQKALNELKKMGEAEQSFFEASKPVFLQTLRDPISEVRMKAFAILKDIGMETAILGAESLGAGFMDIGGEGLKLLTESGSEKEKKSILEQTMLLRDDGLEMEASKILVEMNGKLKTSKRIFESVSRKLQTTAISWLSDLYDQERQARDILISGFGTRFRDIYFKIAFLLATKKDKDAFSYLVILLDNFESESELERVVNRMIELGDPGTQKELLRKAVEDRQGEHDRIFLNAVGLLRDDSMVDTIFDLLKRRKNKRYAFNAILSISGFDQRVEDPDDENPNKRWEEKQHLRKTKILAKLLETVIAINENGFIERLIGGARWARENDADPHLARLINYPDDSIKEKTIAALSFRLEKRDGPKDGLVKMLESKDTVLRFLSAEGLALAGHNDGISILLSAVDLLEDFYLRKRAVKALGLIADARAVDLLLKLANDNEHALSEEAIEAIGHLGKTDRKDEVYVLLSKLSAGNDGISEKAVRGLRWFDTEDGWKLVRLKAMSRDYYYRETAVEMLGYNDDDYTRDILINLITKDTDEYVIEKAVESARRQFGKDSLEPDYAAVQCVDRWYSVSESVKRIADDGDPERVLSILHNCREKTRLQLTEILLNAKPAPLKAAYKALDNISPDSVAVAAHILGKDKERSPDYTDKIVNAANNFFDRWKKTRVDFANKKVEFNKLSSLTNCLKKLMWVSGSYGVAVTTIIEAAKFPFDPYFNEVQVAAVTALSEFTTDEATKALEMALSSGNAEVRSIAAQALSGRKKDIKEVLSDRSVFMRISEGLEKDDAIENAASDTDYQAVVLPLLIRTKDVEGLDAIMSNDSLDEEVRLGAVESLAQLRDETAEKKLSEFAGKDVDEDIKKAVFRALRRSKRARV